MSKIKLYEKFNTRNHGIVTVLDYLDCKIDKTVFKENRSE